jgi:hypothetical protein
MFIMMTSIIAQNCIFVNTKKESGMDQALQQLIEFIKSASPQLWAILIKQVYVDAWMGVLYAIPQKIRTTTI